jgi:hypothetical protein
VTAITYVFHVGDQTFRFPLRFDPNSLVLIDDEAAPLPAWTRLEYRQCSHCTLPKTTEICPFAGALSRIVERLEPFYSYEKAVVEVISSQRTVVGARRRHRPGPLEGIQNCRSRYLHPVSREKSLAIGACR